MNNISGIIVLDGADASGKSTLAKHFIEKYGARYLHCGIYKDVFARHLATFRLAERWASQGELVVIDRLWLSELAYGDTLRGGAKHPVSARCFDRLLLRAAAVQVVCVQKDYEAHLARFTELKKKREEKFNEGQIRDVIQYYLWLSGDELRGEKAIQVTNYASTFRASLDDRPDVMVLEFEDACRDLEGHAEMIINTLRVLRLQQNPIGLSQDTPNLTGHTHLAKYLLVGERLSHPRFRYPFISRDDQLSSALWLNRALDNLEIPESQLVITNALTWFGQGNPTTPEVESLLDDTKHKWEKIVALGRVAATRLSNLGLKEDWDFVLGLKEDWDFVVVPHPQWARRFKYRDHAWYTQVLGEALGIKESA